MRQALTRWLSCLMSTKPWSYLFEDLAEGGPDLRWAGPTHQCLCGNDLLAVAVRFEDSQVAFYLLDVRCLACGAYLIAPTEIDDEPVDT